MSEHDGTFAQRTEPKPPETREALIKETIAILSGVIGGLALLFLLVLLLTVT